MKHSLIYYGHKTLREKALPVETVDDTVRTLIDDMFNIMRRERGIGLAAPQVDVPLRVIVIDTNEKKAAPVALINPVITAFSEETAPYEEGCLSIPGINEDVVRPTSVTVKGLSPDGTEVCFTASGLLARVLQHELDHLDGIFFIDRIEAYKRKEHLAELKKIKKLNRDDTL